MSEQGTPTLRLDGEDLSSLRRLGAPVRFRPGEAVFRRGEPGDSMFLVERGEILLGFGEEKEAKRLGAGELFGELALVLGSHRRTADARAATPCRLRRFDPESVRHLEADDPRLLLRMIRHCCAYLVLSERELIARLRLRNEELERTLGSLRRTRRERDQHQVLALTDDLTGLANRRGLQERLEQLSSTEPRRSLALILLDVDRFKTINDRWGHAFGDQVLRRVADGLRAAVRPDDVTARLGGDEFAVVLPGLREEEASSRAHALLEAIGSFRETPAGREPVAVTVSLGGAQIDEDESWEELLARADLSLYRAKEAGRERLAWGERVVAVSEHRSRG